MNEEKCKKCGGTIKVEGNKQTCLSCGQVTYVLKAEPGKLGMKLTPKK